jgi:hypothetical protein
VVIPRGVPGGTNIVCGNPDSLAVDAALYVPVPPPKPRQNGRPRLKGRCLPTLAQVLVNPATAVWYHSGMPPLPIRWVLVRDLHEEFEPQALLCTDLTGEPEQILEWVVLRWRLEITWQEARAHLGSRRNANGTCWPSLAPLQPCWGSSRSSHCWRDNCSKSMRCRSDKRCGIAKSSPLLRMRSPWCAATCGSRPIFTCHPRNPA